MEPTLDEVRQELADIHHELLSIPADDFARRAEIQDRQNELRQLSHRLVENQPLHDAAALHTAYKRLQEVRDRLLEKHLSGASIGHDAVWGEFALSINKAMDAGIGIDEVEARLREIIGQQRSSA